MLHLFTSHRRIMPCLAELLFHTFVADIGRIIGILGISTQANGAHERGRSYREQNHREIDWECLRLVLLRRWRS